jgi:hypothetical protein
LNEAEATRIYLSDVKIAENIKKLKDKGELVGAAYF